MSTYDFQLSRRRLLAFMAAGGALGIGDLWAQDLGAQTPNLLPDPMIWAPRRLEPLIASPRDAINVFDFEPLAHANVPPAHFAYMASGIGDEVSLRANREGFQHFRLMPRRLIDVSRIDMTMNVFGESYASPIMLAPAGGHLAFHADGEAGTARAAKVGDHPMILSSMTSMPIETVIAERGRPIWYQLYPTDKFEIAKALLAHAERAGCTVAAVTVDVNGPRLQETLLRVRPTDKRPCLACHNTPNGPGLPNGKLQPMWEGVDISGIKSILAPALDWEKLKRIRDTTRMKMRDQGHSLPRRRENSGRRRLRWHHRLQSRRACRRIGPVDDRSPARHRVRGRWAHSHSDRQRLPPRHRYLEGDRHGRHRRRDRPPPICGAWAPSARLEWSACWNCCAWN